MTVKRNGDRVILKGGRVSCSCCAEPECCMYPAEALADGDYTASDLPNTVTIGGVGYSLSGTSYGNTTNGVIFEGTVWAKYTNGARSSRPCLIQGGVEDQFADTYTVSGATLQGSPITVTRTNLCRWEGVDSCGNEVTLIYNELDSGFLGLAPYKWVVEFNEYFPFGEEDICDASFIEGVAGIKDQGQFQNTPVGSYYAGQASIPPNIRLLATVS